MRDKPGLSRKLHYRIKINMFCISLTCSSSRSQSVISQPRCASSTLFLNQFITSASTTSANSSFLLLNQNTVQIHLQVIATATKIYTIDTEKKRLLRGERRGHDDTTTERYDWLMDIIHDHLDGLTARWKIMDDYELY